MGKFADFLGIGDVVKREVEALGLRVAHMNSGIAGISGFLEIILEKINDSNKRIEDLEEAMLASKSKSLKKSPPSSKVKTSPKSKKRA